MAQQNSGKAMASDLCLGRPASSDREDDDELSRRALGWVDQRGGIINHRNNNLESVVAQGREVAGLECYVRALQGEREKLDAFRREVPICVELLDHAIQDSRMKLAKAASSSSSISRSIASLASYRAHHFNNEDNKDNFNNSTALDVNFNKQQLHHQFPGCVYNTHASNKIKSTTTTDEEGGATAPGGGQLRMWGPAPTCSPGLPHAQHDEYNINIATPSELLVKPEARSLISSNPLHDHAARLQHNPMHMNTASGLYPNVYNSFQIGSAPRPPPHLRLINSYDNKPFHQKEIPTPNHCNVSIEVPRIDAFNVRDYSSTHPENMQGLLDREGDSYQEFGVDSCMQEQERTSPAMLVSTSQYNNAPNSGGLNSQTPRKARRCWSPELHQRFLHALQQLGGPQLATPKQIREVMHVEDLTNDEVKSHLQKYRLHTRRPSAMQVANVAGEPAQHPHRFVLFGGIWMPSSPAHESAPMAACHLASAGHATSSPVQSPFMQFQHVIGHNPMQALLSATSTQEQMNVHAGMESASEVDVARSDQSSQNGEAGGVDNNHGATHEDVEDTDIHLGSKPLVSKEITSAITKATYQ